MVKNLSEPKRRPSASKKELIAKPEPQKPEAQPIVLYDDDRTFEQEPVKFITQDDLSAIEPEEDEFFAEREIVEGEPEPEVSDVATRLIDFSDIDEVEGLTVNDGIGDMSGMEASPDELPSFGSYEISKDDGSQEPAPVLSLPNKPKMSRGKKFAIGGAIAACAAALAIGGTILAINSRPQTVTPTQVSRTTPESESNEPLLDTQATAETPINENKDQQAKNYSTQQVADLIKDLEFDGAKLDVPEDQVVITTKEGNVLVTQKVTPEDNGYASIVETATQGCAALSQELNKNKIDNQDAKRVTWLVKDNEDNDKFAITNAVNSAPSAGNFRVLLNTSGGYLLDNGWLDHVKQEMSLANLEDKHGYNPTDLDGKEFAINKPAEETPAETPAETPQEGDAQPTESEAPTQTATPSTTQPEPQQQTQTQTQTQTQPSTSTSTPQTPSRPSGTTSGSSSQGSTSSSTSSGTVETPQSSFGAQAGSGSSGSTSRPNGEWVQPTRKEPIYKDVPVEYTVWICEGCNKQFDTEQECKDHQDNVRKADPSHGTGIHTLKQTRTEHRFTGEYKEVPYGDPVWREY